LSKRTYGILAVIGSAVGAWWWSRQYSASAPTESNVERGTVIFHNTPTPTPLSEEGVI
jgi:hypothetical protein